jgi:hypothetical protein
MAQNTGLLHSDATIFGWDWYANREIDLDSLANGRVHLSGGSCLYFG